MLNVVPMYHIVDGRQPLDTSKRCTTRYRQPPTSSNALRGMRMVRATVRRQSPWRLVPLACYRGPTGERDVMVSERPTRMDMANFRLRMHSQTDVSREGSSRSIKRFCSRRLCPQLTSAPYGKSRQRQRNSARDKVLLWPRDCAHGGCDNPGNSRECPYTTKNRQYPAEDAHLASLPNQ